MPLPSQEELIEIPDIGVDLKATSIQIDKKISISSATHRYVTNKYVCTYSVWIESQSGGGTQEGKYIRKITHPIGERENPDVKPGTPPREGPGKR